MDRETFYSLYKKKSTKAKEVDNKKRMDEVQRKREDEQIKKDYEL